jgi:SAM-dependent methyltransferase
MTTAEEFRARTRATWAAGNWDDFSSMIAPVGQLVLERAGVEPAMRVLDVGTGSGGNIAIPAAKRGAQVVGVDVTPELFVHARRRAADAGVEVEWMEADAQELPFAEASFDRVISTFGAMFAPDHARAAAELVRVCDPSGRVEMTTWLNDGFAGEMFKLTGTFMPPPPPGVESPLLWGDQGHVEDVFGAAGVRPSLSRETVEFAFPSVDEAVARYAEDFGPFIMARAALESEGRWDEFLSAFADLIGRFNRASDGTVRAESEYFLITVER